MRDPEGGGGQQVVFGLAEHRFHLQELAAEHAGDDVELGVHVLSIGLGEIVRIAAATISALPLRLASALRSRPFLGSGHQKRSHRGWRPLRTA